MTRGAESPPAGDAFVRATEPFHAALRVHCYRMLGSSCDAEDVLQDVLLRAWRSRASLADHAAMRPWLYRIATNACLDELARRPRRALASDLGPPMDDPCGELGAPVADPIWLEPMPTAWLDGALEDPASLVSRKESVGLAFVAALQSLTAMQRATVLLRDVVGLSAEETAAALGVTVSSANSALFRARSALRAAAGEGESTGEVDPALLARYIRAWETSDVETLVALLRDDVKTTMPPRPTWVDGRAANAAFYRHMLTARGWVTPLRIALTSANASPALAFFRAPSQDGPYTLRAIQVIAVRDGGIARIDHFMTERAFGCFALSPPSR